MPDPQPVFFFFVLSCFPRDPSDSVALSTCVPERASERESVLESQNSQEVSHIYTGCRLSVFGRYSNIVGRRCSNE